MCKLAGLMMKNCNISQILWQTTQNAIKNKKWLFRQVFIETRTMRKTKQLIYIYICIYMCVCVCVCVIYPW